MENFIALISNTTFINNMILVAFFGGFLLIFFKENNDAKSPLRWIDMLLDEKTGKLSLARVGQFFGIAVSTWVIITLSMKTEWKEVFPMVFPVWLAFIGGTYSFNKYLSHMKKPDDKDDGK